MSRIDEADCRWMRRALSLARRGEGTVSPNPLVGALVVRDGKIVAQGYHRRAGEPHAERMALERAGELARGATVVVNLEPCCHQGRTPPCTELIIQSGIRRVVAGMRDPNPLVGGCGFDALEAAGIEVARNVLEAQCLELNEAFSKHVVSGMPFGVLKAATSLDGKIATRTGSSRWISNERARRMAHGLRRRCDAVLVGIGTLLADDPELTCRLRGAVSPLRVVVDSRLRIPLDAKLLDPKLPSHTLVACLDAADEDKAARLGERGARVLRCPDDGRGRVDLRYLFRALGSDGICSVLVEGGSTIHYSCLESGLIDRVHFVIAPLIIGGQGAPTAVGGQGVAELSQAFRLRDVKQRRLGDNLHLSGLIADRSQRE
ncbi:MAG: bifunctional diaminohydroxyphosphoribosylaminopyrimidine deaminase/5-amino-6-(5-phosphoribosylamino)uracil reductase RibD [Candidatus Alcyoniella australis]|nr:bifunctional diaminohydroxyphosphoribosylaminopyrimidine deaminase/5-amino-6-(5-phosphoribosylamino)uracil reductase RibD [Candidatus Alcyoniella australis]